MTRSARKSPRVLRAIAAAVAVVGLTAVPAAARSTAITGGTAPAAPAGCQAGDLDISVPDAIAGDPDQGMGDQAWNIVFRNISKTACSLRGWPRIAVRTSTGKTVATTVSDVTYSNLTAVPDTRIVLPPGQRAIVTATSAAAPAHCVTRWSLRLTLPGAARPVAVPGPAQAVPGTYTVCLFPNAGRGRRKPSPFFVSLPPGDS